MRDYIEKQVERYPYHLFISKASRGVMVGHVAEAVRNAIKNTHIPDSHGITRQVRAVRMDLASHIFKRKVTTYKQLEDWELWALDKWALETGAQGLSEWMKKKYGEQKELL